MMIKTRFSGSHYDYVYVGVVAFGVGLLSSYYVLGHCFRMINLINTNIQCSSGNKINKMNKPMHVTDKDSHE